jgi:hypothetical protein
MKSKTPANQVLIGLRREIEKENEFKNPKRLAQLLNSHFAA